MCRSCRPYLDVSFLPIGALKSLVTLRFIENVNHHDWQRFQERLWQRNYYDVIIRHEEALRAARGYITDNPKMWSQKANKVCL